MRMTAARRERERLEREAALQAVEEERVRKLGDLFDALPPSPEKLALLEAMTKRIVDLYNDCQFERGDVLLEFLPRQYALDVLTWYFAIEDRLPPLPQYIAQK